MLDAMSSKRAKKILWENNAAPFYTSASGIERLAENPRVPRQKELAALESIGMTRIQLKTVLTPEGLCYSV